MSRLVVVSNRVTVPKSRQKPQAGGLAVALTGALAEYGGIWFGWNGQVVRDPPAEPELTEVDGITYATTPLSRPEYDEYYAGFSNEVLWPVCHFMLGRMEFRPEYRDTYLATNERFAAQLAPLIRGDELVWVHDYHLIPFARALRRHGIQRPIGFFLHIPFPSYGLLRAMPGWREWLRALAEYDLVGLQTPEDRRALETSLVYGLGARFVQGGVELEGRLVRTTAQPVGVEVDSLARMAASSAGSRRVRRLIDSLGSRDLIIGAERLDYSKGLPNRFDAYESLLAHHRERHGRTVFMQIASPSRENIAEYEQLREALESKAGHINGVYADFDWVPTRYMNKTFARASLLGFFRIARVGLVTPLRDGMNLVAKEFVAAQDPEDPGALVLSELAGAATELESALIVNPFDTEGMGDALERALSMPLAERRERWQHMIEVLRDNDLTAWRTRYVADLQAAADDRRAHPRAPEPTVVRDASEAFHLAPEDALRRLPGPAGERFVELWRHNGASVELYAPRGRDLQTPHERGEFYVGARGAATLRCDGSELPCQPGDLLFVPAGVEHRFVEHSDDFAVWVVFVPGETDAPTGNRE
ncbi:MAG: trehalose-6-phosphate synthase [Halofilum sp. (in: g-proteobacteria)]|nr:trehalose-6-phosphate synthase [Halofilum sp. (in: g-proteobacteria)]